MTLATNPAPNSLPHLSGYVIVEQLYTGFRTHVYRAVAETSQRPVIIKFLQQAYPTFHDLLQFRNQFTITKNLNIPGIVRPDSLEPYGNSYALVMEDFGGISLRDYTQDHTLSVSESLVIALQLAEILHDLHQQRVIHKDIKPANLLIHPDSKQIKLIDFSIASLLPRETQTIQNPNRLEGTLAYLSPEQTGRMNRGIDYRSDFYAFGVTLYELLTHQLPFHSRDPMELVHCHLAKSPISPHEINPDLPIAVSDIVLKLMAKNAEDRYQNALGLKHDLETCLHHLKATGTIPPFAIGTRDLSDRFLIPEKLYGREAEVQTLLDAFDRVSQGASELMLVAGFSGIGKTAVVNEVHKPIVKQRGYFIKGKFDQFNRDIPFSAFVQALRNLMQQLLSESDTQLAQWRVQLLAALGDNGQVLIEVIPELEQIIGKQPPATELSGSAAQNRFNLLFEKFIAVFTTAEHPLVIFLDDLQWADSASLQLMKLLMNDQGYLLVLGAYRDNEVSLMHPFVMTVEELKRANMIVNTLTLAPLSFEDMNHLIADTLNCSRELAQSLTELVERKTQGNPFFMTQFLKTLHEEGYIRFNQDDRYWECDITQVIALSLTNDVVEFMARQLQKLPSETQQVLKLAACIGNQFDLATLAIVSEQSPTNVATVLWTALQEGLILPTSQVYKFFQGAESAEAENAVNPSYQFLHDRVQQAAYSLIPNERRQQTHYYIGKLLLEKIEPGVRGDSIFELVSQLNYGISLMTEQTEREELAQLNLIACQKAKSSIAYAAARNFAKIGIELLAPDCWQVQYELTLNLYLAASETAYLNADFEEMEVIAAKVLHAARNTLDKVKIYEIQINALTAQSQPQDAIQIGVDALADLGVEFPLEANETQAEQAFKALAQHMQGKEIEDLVDLPEMSDPHKKAAIELLGILFAPVFLTRPTSLPLLCATMVSLSLRFGNAPASSVGYAGYGMVLCAFFNQVESGYRFGCLAVKLLEQFNHHKSKSFIFLVFGSLIHHRKQALRSTIQLHKQGYVAGLETGDFMSAGYNIGDYFYSSLFSGICLNDWGEEIENYNAVLVQARQESSLACMNMVQQTCCNLQQQVDQPDLLIGASYDETVMIPKHHQDREGLLVAYVYSYKLLLAYLFGRYQSALDYTVIMTDYVAAFGGVAHTPVFHFYAGLTYLAQVPTQLEEKQAEIFALVEIHQNRLVEWAHYAPMNHQHKVDLVEAEKCRLLGKNYEAGDWYDRAISGAKANGFLQEEALANELTAKFYLAWGKEKVAAGYMQEAYYCYARWGAKAKTDDLEQHYPQLLHPIFQQATQSFNPLETFASISSSPVSIHTSTQTSRSASTSINTALDFTAVLKASQSLSSSIQLDELLHQLTQIILQNAGGDHCALILPDPQGVWYVAAIATPDTIDLYSDPLEGNPNLPVKLIQYVKNTQAAVGIDELKTDLPVIDEYLTQRHPKSLLCLPILNQAQLIGILYLHNQSTSGVFTSDRILILNFLCTQAAISLENARLYQQAQAYAQQLEQSQLQIVQSEKMASLGNLVAGVAHEINNPVGFLNGSINNAKDYVKDLLDYIALYQQHHPNAAPPVQAKAEEIDLEFLSEDLPKLLSSIKGATDRIKGISTSLRTFSRADTEHKVSANLHEGLDSTLLILKYRLKANELRPAIQVMQLYGELPEIDCFPGQLNQVLMNILANAIDMFDEMAQTQSFAELEANPQHITIQTKVDSHHVVISIADNGKGMTEEVSSRIFDHLFTTKGVGKGTGLGLAIARQIVEEKHGGTILVNSTLGAGTEFIIQLPM